MKNFKKRLVALCLSAALIIPVVGSALVTGVKPGEPGISTCAGPSGPAYGSILPDDIEIHP